MLAVLLPGAPSGVYAAKWRRPTSPEYYAPTIARYEARDAARPPRPGSVLFVGSSSIRRWSTLDEDMQPLSVLNRGFGGAHIAHVDYYANRIIVPYRPRGIVFYAGDNDLARFPGMSAEELLDDLKALLATLERAGVRVPVYIVSIKPSPRRERFWPRMREANALFERFAASRPRLRFVDVATEMLDEQGRPRDELFVSDGLHLNRHGYALWASVLRPLLLSELGPDAS